MNSEELRKKLTMNYAEFPGNPSALTQGNAGTKPEGKT
jgi:hypothetical protein